MRDPVLDEALRRFAAEAATRFTSLTACGEEVPFDVAEDDGGSAFFYRYVPLTEEFVRRHEGELRSLPSFSPACGAINLAGAAVPFLEARGQSVPYDPDERAAAMLVIFISELWAGCAEFTLDRTKLDTALAGIEAETRDVHEADLLVTPVVGLSMDVNSLELADGVRLVRAETVDAPIEAMRSEGMQREAWQPQFLALVEQGAGVGAPGDAPAGAAATDDAIARLHATVTAMRLFKRGGVGLGPYAFAPTAEGQWRRVATGAAPTRPGGYALSEDEGRALAEVCATIAPRLRAAGASRVPGALGWSLRRYELGTERAEPLEAMTDHLLALRSVLEGDGPVGAPMPVRAAALIAPRPEREAAQARIERALRIEKEMIGGARVADDDAGEARELALWLEDSVRGILRESALGVLGDVAGLAADESLLAAGLGEGEGSLSQRGETDEWDAFAPAPQDAAAPIDAFAPAPQDATEPPEFDLAREVRAAIEADRTRQGGAAAEINMPEFADSVRPELDDDEEEITRVMEPIPSNQDEIRITAMSERSRESERPFDADDEEGDMAFRSDWLSEVSGGDRSTIEWPAEAVGATSDQADAREPELSHAREHSGPREFSDDSEMPRNRVDTPRVRHLFPVPDDADWSVRELDYHRTDRRIA